MVRASVSNRENWGSKLGSEFFIFVYEYTLKSNDIGKYPFSNFDLMSICVSMVNLEHKPYC